MSGLDDRTALSPEVSCHGNSRRSATGSSRVSVRSMDSSDDSQARLERVHNSQMRHLQDVNKPLRRTRAQTSPVYKENFPSWQMVMKEHVHLKGEEAKLSANKSPDPKTHQVKYQAITRRPNNSPALAPVECNPQILAALKMDAKKADSRLMEVSADIISAGTIITKSLLELDNLVQNTGNSQLAQEIEEIEKLKVKLSNKMPFFPWKSTSGRTQSFWDKAAFRSHTARFQPYRTQKSFQGSQRQYSA
ncbi:hypothetical protein E2C01_067630 [Portunus trituberculatus]|uniref:Uncharacterized protein n=1 Tax=Portunus trituberculatus TaxID=210409 RepID=A0A5B7HUA1_PORTR|nr:hypothetical protein [Portunus trituberculatus]